VKASKASYYYASKWTDVTVEFEASVGVRLETFFFDAPRAWFSYVFTRTSDAGWTTV